MTYLGEIFTIRKGRKEVKSFENISLRYIQIDDLRNNDYLKYCVKNPKNVLCDPSDILIAWDGANAGTIGYGLKGAIGSTIAKLSTERKDVFIPYVGKFLQSKSKYLRERCTGATIPHISRNELDKIKIPLPPLETQKKIAAILDKADELRRNDQKILEKYDQLAQSVFLEMFGDPVRNPKGWLVNKFGDYIEYLGDIGSNGSNETVANNLVMFDTEDYAIMIRTVNLNSNNFSKNIKYISKKTYDFFSKSQIFGGEIIMNKIGSAGEFWIMPNLDRPVSLGLNQFVIRLKSLNTIYLYSFLSTNYGKLNIKSRIRGVATKSITKSAVRELPLLYPPIDLQNQFAKRVQMIEKQKKITQQSLQKSEELFQSLLQNAFREDPYL